MLQWVFQYLSGLRGARLIHKSMDNKVDEQQKKTKEGIKEFVLFFQNEKMV